MSTGQVAVSPPSPAQSIPSDSGMAATASAAPAMPLTNLFPYSGQPDIVRANQKDSYYQLLLRNQLSEVAQLFKGSRFQATHQNKIELASRFIYNALTTMLGTQTLGEEYCDIMQISDSTKTYPSFLRRFLLVTFTSGGRIGLRYLISSLQQRLLVHRLRHPNKHAVRWVEIVVEWLSKSDNFEWTASTVATLHLLIFYFTGKYYHLSKRLSGIRYVFMRPLRQGEEPIGYEVLGLLLLIQTIVRLVKYAADKRRARIDASKDQSPPPEGALATSSTKLRWADLDNIDQSKDQVTDGQKQQSVGLDIMDGDGGKDSSSDDENQILLQKIMRSEQTCSLCWSDLDRPAATPCGHLFCWDCIFEWHRIRSECPLCRQPANASQILPVYNY